MPRQSKNSESQPEIKSQEPEVVAEKKRLTNAQITKLAIPLNRSREMARQVFAEVFPGDEMKSRDFNLEAQTALTAIGERVVRVLVSETLEPKKEANIENIRITQSDLLSFMLKNNTFKTDAEIAELRRTHLKLLDDIADKYDVVKPKPLKKHYVHSSEGTEIYPVIGEDRPEGYLSEDEAFRVFHKKSVKRSRRSSKKEKTEKDDKDEHESESESSESESSSDEDDKKKRKKQKKDSKKSKDKKSKSKK